MKIRLNNPITNTAHVESVRFTTAHSASHYGQPVMVSAKNGLLDHQNWVLQGGVVLKCTPKEAEQFKQWHSLIDAMSGR